VSLDGTWEKILDRLRAGCDEAEGPEWTISASLPKISARRSCAREIGRGNEPAALRIRYQSSTATKNMIIRSQRPPRTHACSSETVGGAARGKAIIILNPAEPPLIMRDTVLCLLNADDPAAPEGIHAWVTGMVEQVASYVPGSLAG